MIVLVAELRERCDRCGEPWDLDTDRCTAWWCWNSPRLGTDARSRLVGTNRRTLDGLDGTGGYEP